MNTVRDTSAGGTIPLGGIAAHSGVRMANLAEQQLIAQANNRALKRLRPAIAVSEVKVNEALRLDVALTLVEELDAMRRTFDHLPHR